MKFVDVLANTLPKAVKQLGVVLKNLDLDDNFSSYKIEKQTIAANTEVRFRHNLNVVPRTMIINKQTGNALVTAGDTIWDEDFVYIKNHDSTNSAVVTITFLR